MTETEFTKVSILRPRLRLKVSESQCQHRDWETLWLSRPRFIETRKFCGCRDRDSLRLGNFVVVETETKRDWEFLWLSRPRPVKTEQKLSRPRLHRESRWSLHHIPSYTAFATPLKHPRNNHEITLQHSWNTRKLANNFEITLNLLSKTF